MNMQLDFDAMFLNGNKITIDEFNKIVKEHALWLEDKKHGKCANFSELDLGEFNLNGLNLSCAKFIGTNLMDADLTGANLTGANFMNANLINVNLTNAILDDAIFVNATVSHSRLNKVSASQANFIHCTMWDNDFTEAKMLKSVFPYSKLCDGNFTKADLTGCDFYLADIDYANFTMADLTNANFTWAQNSYYANFEKTNLKGTIFTECQLDDTSVKGAKDLFIPLACPEEGSFIAWIKSHDNKIVKIKVPENAARTGSNAYYCRASEIFILEIFEHGNICSETIGLLNDNKAYHKGDTVKTENYNESILNSGEGIYFCLSRKEAENAEPLN